MIDDWFEVIRLPISLEQFQALPRNPAYKYEYLGQYALLSPRPKTYRAVRDLEPRPGPGPIDARRPVVVRPLREDDWGRLPPLFSAAFHGVQPFAGLDDDRRLEASRECLEKTRDGGDGPPIPSACVVAVDPEDDRPVGAALVTLHDRYREEEIHAIADDGALPHLTWIFVAPMMTRHGIGSALLDAATDALIALGHRAMASTFLLGNESSTLWHWSNGFRLLSYLGSPRRIERELRRSRDQD